MIYKFYSSINHHMYVQMKKLRDEKQKNEDDLDGFSFSPDELEQIVEKLPKDKIYEDLLNLYEVNDKQLDNPELIMSKLEYIYNFKQPLD